MRVEKRHGRSRLLGVLELLHAHFQAGDVLSHELGSCLAFPIIVLAAVRLLGADALFASGLCSFASLGGRGARISYVVKEKRRGGMGKTYHLALATSQTGLSWYEVETSGERMRDVSERKKRQTRTYLFAGEPGR